MFVDGGELGHRSIAIGKTVSNNPPIAALSNFRFGPRLSRSHF
jgi:hypothetical protein